MVHYAIERRIIYDSIVVITVSGGLDTSCAAEMKLLFDHLTEDGYLCYILDVTDLSFAESPGFRLLIQEVNDLQDRGGTLVVVGLSGRVARAFNLLRLGSLVPTADTVRSAISQIHGNSVPNAATGTHG